MTSTFIGYYFNSNNKKIPCEFAASLKDIRKAGNNLYICRTKNVKPLIHVNNRITSSVICFFKTIN